MITSDKQTTFIGKINFRGNEKVFGVKNKDRRQHMYVLGKTGVGKTALLKNLALQDIRAGRGIGIIDPHGEFVEEVLAQIPEERMKDVVYFNPVDSDYPIGFNVLEVPDAKYKHLVVSDLLGIFTKIWANVWSARMEYILQNCILALLDTPGTTLLGIPRLLVDKDYRQQIVANVKDPVVKSFWVHEYETWRDQFRNEAIVPIQNKVNQFLNTSFIRNIVGQPKSSLNIPQIMNEGKILLVNVSKGRIGEDNSALLGAMIITKVQLAAMERVRVAEEERRDFYLYVDEFQNFATDSFASILSEARKYRLNLIIAHQYVGQLVTDVSTKVRDAVFGNVGTMIVFRIGATDAEFLEKEFMPEFVGQDLINLPNYCVYLKVMVDGVTSRPFSAITIPPLQFENDPSTKEKILKLSRENYARPRLKVEQEIAHWSGLGIEGEFIGGGEEGKFEAVCWNCGKDTTVPFKPDGRRPVYCPTCYKQIEEGKLVPLPERMPQIGRPKFETSLGELGIEFQEKGGFRRDTGGPRDREPAEFRQKIREAPMFRQRSRDKETEKERVVEKSRELVRKPTIYPHYPHTQKVSVLETEGEQESSFSPTKKIWPPGRGVGIYSRPILRVPQGVKPISLSHLKVVEKDGGGQKDGEKSEKTSSPNLTIPKKQGVNLDELKKVMEEAEGFKKEPEKKEAPKEETKDSKNNKKVIAPGEAVKF